MLEFSYRATVRSYCIRKLLLQKKLHALSSGRNALAEPHLIFVYSSLDIFTSTQLTRRNEHNFNYLKHYPDHFKPLLTRIVNVSSGFQFGVSCLKDVCISMFSRISSRPKNHLLSIKFQLFPTTQIISSLSCFLVNCSPDCPPHMHL